MVLLQSYVIMPGGRLRGIENKRICRISGLKSGRGHLLESFLKQYLTEKQKSYFQCSRYERVDFINYLIILKIILFNDLQIVAFLLYPCY